MNEVTEVKFTEIAEGNEITRQQAKGFHVPLIYKILFAVQFISMSIIVAAAKGWLN